MLNEKINVALVGHRKFIFYEVNSLVKSQATLLSTILSLTLLEIFYSVLV